ncbi:MAG: GNAT family N-acetyltransferase, partial [Micromonosporaceae bacterium]
MSRVDAYPEIRTARLLMRRWRDSDRAPFAAMNADPEVMRYFPAPRDRAESDRNVDLFEQRFDEQ